MTHSATHEIRGRLAGVRAALTGGAQPDFAAQMGVLAAAAAQLQDLARGWQQAPPAGPERAAVRAELEALEAELGRLKHLVDAGEEFWRGWARMLGLDTGYTAAGVEAPLLTPAAAPPRLRVKG
jgi:hypothetical protein